MSEGAGNVTRTQEAQPSLQGQGGAGGAEGPGDGGLAPTGGCRIPVYPYPLRNVRITRPNQVWAADITYLPMARGFLHLVAVMDWHSRYVLAWRVSNTLEAGFCAEALEEALGQGQPEVFNTDQSLPLRRQGAASSPAWSSPRSSRTGW